MKVTRLGPMASNCKRRQGLSWTAAPAEDEHDSREIYIILLLIFITEKNTHPKEK
jgi:hypothetical protein